MQKQSNSWVWESLAKKIPWKEIFFGLFLPMNILHYFMHQGKMLMAIFVPIAFCLVYIIVEKIRTHKLSTLALMTAGMIFINFATSFLHHPSLYLLIEMLDNTVVGLLFLVTLPTAKPFVLNFIEQETLDRIPETIKQTPYYMKAWRIVNAAWGIGFTGMGILMTVAKAAHSSLVGVLDLIAGWPLVVILFAFSVTFPQYYWGKKFGKYESRKPAEETA